MVLIMLTAVCPGSYRSWKDLEFRSHIFQAWNQADVPESHGNANCWCFSMISLNDRRTVKNYGHIWYLVELVK